MLSPDTLRTIEDLEEGQRIVFAPRAVGIRHTSFGQFSDWVKYVERQADALVAELEDGRRCLVKGPYTESGSLYSLCRFE